MEAHHERRSALDALVWATCVVLCAHGIHFAAAETSPAGGISAAAESAGKAMADSVVSALGGDVAKAKAVLELARTETNSAIRGLITRPAALAAANLHLTMHDTNGIGANSTIAAVEQEFEMLINSAAEAETAATMRAARDRTTAVLRAGGGSNEFARVSLFFKDNKGRYAAVSFTVRLVPPTKWQRQDVPYYRVRFAFMDGTFEPAPDFMVIRESKSNIWRSKSKDRIVPIHRGLTDQHVNLVMGVVMPRLASFMLAEQKAICADGACGSTGYETVPLDF